MPFLSMPFVTELYVGDELKIYASKQENEGINRKQSDNNGDNNISSFDKAESVNSSTSTTTTTTTKATETGNENVRVNSASVSNDFIAAVTCIQFDELQQSTKVDADVNLQKSKQHSQKSKNNKAIKGEQSETRECLLNDSNNKELIRVCLLADVFTNASLKTDDDIEQNKEDNMENNLHNANQNKEVQSLTLASCYFASLNGFVINKDDNKESKSCDSNGSKELAMTVNSERHVKLTCPLVFTPQSQIKALRAVAYVEKVESFEEVQQEEEEQQWLEQENKNKNSHNKASRSNGSKYTSKHTNCTSQKGKRNREYQGERVFVVRLLGQQQTELSAKQVVLMSS